MGFQLPIPGCNLGVMGGTRRSNHIPPPVRSTEVKIHPWRPERGSWTSFGTCSWLLWCSLLQQNTYWGGGMSKLLFSIQWKWTTRVLIVVCSWHKAIKWLWKTFEIHFSLFCILIDPAILKLKVLYWNLYFHEEPLTALKTFHCTQKVI